MVGQVPTMFIPIGASTNKSPGFDGKNFYYWKGKMKLFLESHDVDASVEIDKPNKEWTPDEKAKVLLNSRAKFFLTCALSIFKYDKINGCETT